MGVRDRALWNCKNLKHPKNSIVLVKSITKMLDTLNYVTNELLHKDVDIQMVPDTATEYIFFKISFSSPINQPFSALRGITGPGGGRGLMLEFELVIFCFPDVRQHLPLKNNLLNLIL